MLKRKFNCFWSLGFGGFVAHGELDLVTPIVGAERIGNALSDGVATIFKRSLARLSLIS